MINPTSDRRGNAASPVINPDETLDDLGSFKIIQKKNGYRFTADSVLLADFVLPLKPSDSVVDLGTGSGVIPLMLAQNTRIQNIIGMEIQEGLAAMARRNVELNGLSSRVKIIKGDFRTETGAFSVVVSNPPYTKIVSGRVSPLSEKASAKMEISCCLEELVEASRRLAAGNGRIAYIYPLSRLKEMFSVLERNNLRIARLKIVEPKRGCKVKRFLIEAAPPASFLSSQPHL